jgi:hypothetical protein
MNLVNGMHTRVWLCRLGGTYALAGADVRGVC